jgi:hypothetical protein
MSDDLVTLKMDMSVINDAIPRMLAQSKQELGALLRNEVARPLLRKIIAITYGDGSLADAKRRVENNVAKDRNRAFQPMNEPFLRHLAHYGYHTKYLEDSPPAQRFITRLTGYVAGGNTAAVNRIFQCMEITRTFAPSLTSGFVRGQRDPVTGRMLRTAQFAVRPRDASDALGEARKHAGILGSGWFSGAEALDVSVPLWMSRHGITYGHCILELDGERMRILISNDVRYAENVRNLARRVQTAVDWQGRDMNRRIDDFARKTVQL